MLLTRAATVITRPLDRMVDTANTIAAGDLDRRLDPSDPGTELGRMAEAFDQMIDALDEAVHEARDAETRSRRFLADAAHQLRTPLAGLRASAETLLAHPDGPDRDRMAANVARESARLSRLVSSLLQVARLDRGEPPARRPTDLRRLVAGELERQRALAPTLTFELDTVPDLPTVSCDPHAIRDALANLPADQIRPDPLVRGGDLIALGLEPGPRFKEILAAVEDAQLDGSVRSREDALRLVHALATE